MRRSRVLVSGVSPKPCRHHTHLPDNYIQAGIQTKRIVHDPDDRSSIYARLGNVAEIGFVPRAPKTAMDIQIDRCAL